MKPPNAKFKPFASYKNAPVSTLEDVMDLARALEDTAHAVIEPWVALPLDDHPAPPTPEECRDAKSIRVGEEGPYMRAWLCARLPVPGAANLFDPSSWGNWRLQIDSDGLADIYADGKLVKKDSFLHDNIELVPALGSNHQPWVCCSLDTTIQRVKWEMARASLSGLKEMNDIVRDVARSLRTAASLLMTRNPRINRFISGEVTRNRSPLSEEERARLTDQLISAARKIDTDALAERNGQRFSASLKSCRTALAPLAQFAKRFHLFLLGVAHMDLAWKWRWPETIACMQGTLANQAEFMKKYADFTFLETSPPVWYALKTTDPKLFSEIQEFADKTQFEPAGGMWCEPDGHMLGAESWVRQTLFGQRAALDVCGTQSRSGHNTDAFGFTWAMPKICAQSEMEAFLTQKMRYNQFTIFEDVLFWWESDDGSRILGVHTYPDHYQEVDPDEMAEALRIFHLTSGVYSAALLFGIGNHGGGPLPDMFDRIDEMRNLTVYPNVHLAGMNDYLDHLKAKEAAALKELPVIRDELFLECHHKTYTVQARVKQANRDIERALYNAEALCCMAGFNGNAELSEAWKIALFNQFHDILPGTSFPMVYQDVFEDYEKAFTITGSVEAGAKEALLGTGGKQYAVNTLPWRRPAQVYMDPDNESSSGRARDDSGKEFPWQKTGRGNEAVAVIPEMPGCGIRAMEADVDSGKEHFSVIPHGENWVENRFFRVEFDPQKGTISSLKTADGFEFCRNGIGRLDLIEDDPEGFYQTWNMNLTGREDPAACNKFELVEAGPVRVRFRAHLSYVRWEKKKDFMVPIMWHSPAIEFPTSFFTVDTIIYRDLPYIECVMKADWWEDDTDLKVAADTTLKNTRAFYSIPFGRIERPTRRETAYEKARFEVPALNWADITDGEHGLAIFNTGRHGHDALGGRLRLTLLTSPWGGEKVHVTDPLADRGKHEIRYAFYPHTGGPETGHVARTAMEYEYPALSCKGGTPAVPVGNGLLEVDPEKLLVTAVKPSEDAQAVILRCFETKGRESALDINGTLASGPRSLVNFLEHPAGQAPDRLKPHEVVSIRMER